MDDCVFCKIVAGDIPSYKVYEDDKIFAFLDIDPLTKGHTLLIPKQHTADLSTADDEDLKALIIATKDLANRYKEILGSDGFNTRNNNGDIAHQDVFHLHMHLIPRYKDDGLDLSARDVVGQKVDLEVLHKELNT